MYDFSTIEGVVGYEIALTTASRGIPLLAGLPLLLFAFFFVLVWGGTPAIEWLINKFVDFIHWIFKLFEL